MDPQSSVEYDPFDDAMLDDPFPVYARLRAESPVHYLARHDCWALSRFEDVWNAGADPESFPSPGPSLSTASMSVILGESEEPQDIASIFAMNPPQHTTIRKAVARHFSPGGVRRLEPAVRAAARECLEKGRSHGRLDVIGDLAAQISVKVACLLIGLPVSDGEHLTGIVRRFFAREPGVEGMPPDGMQAAQELHEYLLAAVKERRRRGTGAGDVLDQFMTLAVDGAPYDDEQLAQHLNILVVGGTETLPKVFAGGVLQLYRHPEQRAELVADPALIVPAFEEIARYEMPTQFLQRTLGRDMELRGQKLREGQGVLFLYRSANRDEREFDAPDRFDIHRRAPRILSFGHGTHVCLGQHAARLEARVLYEELLAAIPEYEVVESEVVPARSEFVAGYLEMPIVF